jgi:hypothetical protein
MPFDAAAPTAQGIAYQTRLDCPGLFFRCQARGATLKTTACANDWRIVRDAAPDERGSRAACVDCPIGAAHAGEPIEHRSAIYRAEFCPRSRRGGERLIWNRLGVSAYNRQIEVQKGANGKGTAPTLRLDARRIGIAVDYGGADQRYVEIRDSLTADALELALQALRVVPGRVAIHRAIGRQPITTEELARLYRKKSPTPRGIGSQSLSRHRVAPVAAHQRRAPAKDAAVVDDLRGLDPRDALRRLLAR